MSIYLMLSGHLQALFSGQTSGIIRLPIVMVELPYCCISMEIPYSCGKLSTRFNHLIVKYCNSCVSNQTCICIFMIFYCLHATTWAIMETVSLCYILLTFLNCVMLQFLYVNDVRETCQKLNSGYLHLLQNIHP